MSFVQFITLQSEICTAVKLYEAWAWFGWARFTLQRVSVLVGHSLLHGICNVFCNNCNGHTKGR